GIGWNDDRSQRGGDEPAMRTTAQRLRPGLSDGCRVVVARTCPRRCISPHLQGELPVRCRWSRAAVKSAKGQWPFINVKQRKRRSKVLRRADTRTLCEPSAQASIADN